MIENVMSLNEMTKNVGERLIHEMKCFEGAYCR